MSREIPCTYDEMRSIVVEAISRGSQLAELYSPVAAIGQKRFQPPAEQTGQFGVRTVSYFSDQSGLSSKDKGRVSSVFWDLIIEGIIRPGLADGQNDKLPFYHVTERGQQFLSDGGATPYDPDGYLKRLSADVPHLDPVVLTYLTEALSTFRIGCLLSSTISLGCASEKILLLLIEAYASALPEERQKKFRKEVEGRMIKRQFEELSKHLESSIKAKLPADLRDDLDVHVLGVFTLIRNMRNDAGHPTGKQIDRGQANANLTLFPVYTRHVYRLIDWLGQNSF